MLKMFTTQLMGLFKKITEGEEFGFEDGARLLAQGPAGDGHIYIFGTHEMKAVEFEALEGAEPLQQAIALTEANLADVTGTDRVMIISRFSTDEAAGKAAAFLAEKQIPFVSVSAAADPENPGSLESLSDVHIDLRLTKGLLPDDFGGRFGFPSAMAALFVYYGLKFTIDEILSENDL